jgi:hypothetical protein
MFSILRKITVEVVKPVKLHTIHDKTDQYIRAHIIFES